MTKTETRPLPAISKVDAAALKRAIALLRASSDPADRQFVEMHMADTPWHQVGRSCASILQCRNLSLRPWQLAPANIKNIEHSLSVVANDHRAEFRAAALLRKMLMLGLSQFDPTPVESVADVEQRGAPLS